MAKVESSGVWVGVIVGCRIQDHGTKTYLIGKKNMAAKAEVPFLEFPSMS